MAEGIRTLADLPFHVSGRYPKPVLIRRCQADAADATELSSREFFEQIRDLSLGLGTLGVEAGDRVAILSESRPEWLIADFAVLTRGAVTVPIYPTLPEGQVRYILADSGARAVVASDETQAAKVRAVWSELPELSVLIVVDAAPAAAPAEPASADDAAPSEAAPAAAPSAGDPESAAPARRVREELSLVEATARGHRRLMDEDGLGRMYKEAAAAIPADKLATIIYTSGTTGEPKGGDAEPRERRQQHPVHRRRDYGHGRRRGALVPAAQPRLRADGLLLLSLQGSGDLVRGVARHDRPRPPGGSGRRRSPACPVSTRSCTPASTTRWRRHRRFAAASSTGPCGWGERRAAPRGRAGTHRSEPGCSTASQTVWCSRRFATDSAGASASSSQGARP